MAYECAHEKRLWIQTIVLGTALVAGGGSATASGLVGISNSALTSSTLWDINLSTGTPSNPRTVSTAPNRAITSIASGALGTLYGVSGGSPTDIPPAGKLYTINPTSGAATFIADLTPNPHIVVGPEGDIAVDPTTGNLFAVSGVGYMSTINTTTGVVTTVGNLPTDLPGGSDYSGMAFDSSGELFVWSTFGPVLRKVNKSTAAVISTVALSPSPGGAIGGMSFDPLTGTAYLGGGSSGPKLSTVNTTSGAVMSVGPLTGMAGVWAIDFVCVQAPIQDLDVIVEIYESTSFTPTKFVYGATAPALLNRLSGALTASNNDFVGAENEYYDVFYSDADGSPNAFGSYLTFETTWDVPAPSGGGLNIAGVSLTSGVAQWANVVASFDSLNSSTYISGSESFALGPDLNTDTTMGNTVGTTERLRLTLGFPASSCGHVYPFISETSVPTLSHWGQVVLGILLLTAMLLMIRGRGLPAR